MAQTSAFVAMPQSMAVLPGEVSNVSFVDGHLYCYASDVLLCATRTDNQLTGFSADTTFVKINENVQYVVRHPVTGHVFFTMLDKEGNSYLYEYAERKGKPGKAKRVKMGGMTVEHPTFSIDGRFMIFSSRDQRHSFGGYDLWFSQLEGQRWSKPQNLGGRINTKGDELTPSIYRDCLIFSSNGHADDNGYLSVYSSRLISDEVIGDTIGMLQIGRCRVQRLPEPINHPNADDFDMIIDTASECGYWVSNGREGDRDSQLYSFCGAIDGVVLWGRVVDEFDKPQSDVAITVIQADQTVCTTTSDEDGFYRIYLQSGQYFDLRFRKDGFFVLFDEFSTNKTSSEFLIADRRLDAKLRRLPQGQPIIFNDLFGPGVDIELSARGRKQISQLVQFLKDNPSYSADLTLRNDLTSDATFNSLLTKQRINYLHDYLLSLLPSTTTMVFHNGCEGKSGCSSASGISRLVVLISDGNSKSANKK